MSLPIAPPLADCDGSEYLFRVATGTPVPSEARGLPLWQFGITEEVDLAHLDATDFWQRGGPVCWGHGLVIGRTTSLRYDPAQHALQATMRFAAIPEARWVQREISRGTVFGASIAFTSHVKDEDLQIPGHRLLIRRAVLTEWSIVNYARDLNARVLGQVVLVTDG